ncbi:MAG: NAD(P)/FAD-dependent oxidoreductase [Bacteroidota bacterium]|nr:NAD(P)/FAD-dependent oxidoreductase [Bacteroidota bacterium]
MTNRNFDCAIIGGGLAGLTLAIQLAEVGYSVILLEKRRYPFHKVCGEYISMESYGFLERIGIPLSTMNLPMINEVKISSPNGNSITRKLNLGGFGISRYTLDSTLAALAVKKGVVLLEETKVSDIVFENDSFTIKAAQQTYKAKVACGAFGKRSVMNQKLGKESKTRKKNYIAVKYHVKMDLPDNRIELHNFKDGYCGVSKVDGDKYCLCYLTNSQNLRDSNNDIKEMEQNVLMKNPFLNKYFSEAVFLYNQPFTISQITFSKKKAVESNVLMLGDSAGNIAPLCGNGMSMAMHASYVAFQLIKKYLDKSISRKNLELLYENQWNLLFSKRIKTGKHIQQLFGREALTNISIEILKKLPALTDKLIGVTHGNKF